MPARHPEGVGIGKHGLDDVEGLVLDEAPHRPRETVRRESGVMISTMQSTWKLRKTGALPVHRTEAKGRCDRLRKVVPSKISNRPKRLQSMCPGSHRTHARPRSEATGCRPRRASLHIDCSHGFPCWSCALRLSSFRFDQSTATTTPPMTTGVKANIAPTQNMLVDNASFTGGESGRGA